MFRSANTPHSRYQRCSQRKSMTSPAALTKTQDEAAGVRRPKRSLDPGPRGPVQPLPSHPDHFQRDPSSLSMTPKQWVGELDRRTCPAENWRMSWSWLTCRDLPQPAWLHQTTTTFRLASPPSDLGRARRGLVVARRCSAGRLSSYRPACAKEATLTLSTPEHQIDAHQA